MPKALAKASAFGNDVRCAHDVCLRAHEGKYHIIAARSDQHRFGAKRRSIIRRVAPTSSNSFNGSNLSVIIWNSAFSDRTTDPLSCSNPSFHRLLKPENEYRQQDKKSGGVWEKPADPLPSVCLRLTLNRKGPGSMAPGTSNTGPLGLS